MTTIFLTGTSGFVGSNLTNYLSENYVFINYIRGTSVEIDQDIVIHLAGKAHDIKNVLRPDDYYKVNTEFTKEIFDAFLKSNAKMFITLSSVKAVADNVNHILTEQCIPNPITHYGKSKLLAENYIFSKKIPENKRVYVLRPCMIHGPGNKGNLNQLFKFVSKGMPWPLGAFENKRSFCSIENLIFVINELIVQESIPSGIYNVADDEPLSTNDIISYICETLVTKPNILKIPKHFIQYLAKVGDIFKLPMNEERLEKLTHSYVVSNQKIKSAIGKNLPITSKNGLIKTFKFFNKNNI